MVQEALHGSALQDAPGQHLSMTTLEHVIQRYIAARLNGLQDDGMLVWCADLSGLLRRGVQNIMQAKELGMQPGQQDFWIGRYGEIVFVELKARKTAITDNQKARHKLLMDHGFRTYVVRANDGRDGWNQVVDILIDVFASTGVGLGNLKS